MQQIRQALKRKQAQVAQLSKEIELLQQAEEKLREIAPLLSERDEEEASLLVEVEEDVAQPNSNSSSDSPAVPVAAEPMKSKAVALRWP